ncbi:MAG: rod shape-determining protein MreC [Kiritimatiellales bacterium]|nr:rod shape-determining protein MreC [Kiritimatiellales bacterium]
MRDRKPVYAAVLGILLIVVFTLPAGISLWGKGVLRGIVSPLQRGISGVGQHVGEAVAAVRGLGGMVEKNRELSAELVHMQAELNTFKNLDEENRRLRRMLDFHRQEPRQMIPCEVMSRNISGWWNTVRIGKGARHGIQWNRAVISPDGLVGKTLEVSHRTSEVILISDPACRVSARILRVNAFGVVSGHGANASGHPVVRMDFINKDAEVRAGDEVVTSGLGGVFPTGIHIGYVQKVERDESGLYQSAQIIPRATAGLLDYVFVISEPEDNPTGGGAR